ncbi:ABC transporter, putative [Entamoeba histolytica HM-3:IMSS]|uniref:ABC transporter, putative n=1 Tax=Entamoeba histolytica HM-3:IMSS TaxID=885315 RepID=M7WEH5_ENTHI|nr:ABC transporter, putative [Entamoeba histolytica HM-3:IMSS]
MTSSYLSQLWVLIKRNALIQWRSPGKVISQFVLGLCVLLLLLIFDKTLIEQPSFTLTEDIRDQTLPECPEFLGDDCIDLYIFNNNPNNKIVTNNDVLELYETFKQHYPMKNIIVINSTNMNDRTIEDFLYDEDLHYVATLILHPSTSSVFDSTPTILQYSVLVNPHMTQTIQTKSYMQISWETQEFLISKMNKKSVTINFKYQRFPNNKDETLQKQLLGDISGPYLFVIYLINFIIFLNLIVGEKENEHRLYMKMVGMYDSAYWIAHFIQNMIISFFLCWFVIGIGAACGFRLMTKANLFCLFIVMWTFTFSLTCFAYFLATLMSKTRIAITSSIGFFIVGLIFQLLAETSMFVDAIFNNLAYIYIVILGLFPPLFFGTSMSAFTKRYDYGLTWSDMLEKVPNSNVFGPFYSMLLMFCIGIFWIIVGTLILISSESENGWLFEVFGYKTLKQLAKKVIKEDEEDEMDEDVDAEKKMTLDESNKKPMRLYNVRKTFYTNWPYKSKNDVHAVRGVTLSVDAGTVFTLLGHNGAGKSTLIKIITGQHIPSHGRIFMGGVDLASDLSYVRSQIGLCPQHDVIFPVLTGREHLRFYGSLKGLKGYTLEQEVENLLDLVSLTKAGDKQVGNYSGGMKRRLSVAIACIAKPKCVILDEPTTGMDPVSRREVWKVIEKIKVGKTVLLTTHYMDEAEILSDKIAIMSRGKIQCIGSSTHLKSKFGTGYVLTLNADIEEVNKVEKTIIELIPEAKVIQKVSGKLKIGIGYTQSKELLTLLTKLESKEINVVNWGVSPSSLEEVFLSCTGMDYKDTNKTLSLDKFIKGTYQRDDNNEDHIEIIDEIEMTETDKPSDLTITPLQTATTNITTESHTDQHSKDSFSNIKKEGIIVSPIPNEQSSSSSIPLVENKEKPINPEIEMEVNENK